MQGGREGGKEGGMEEGSDKVLDQEPWLQRALHIVQCLSGV